MTKNYSGIFTEKKRMKKKKRMSLFLFPHPYLWRDIWHLEQINVNLSPIEKHITVGYWKLNHNFTGKKSRLWSLSLSSELSSFLLLFFSFCSFFKECVCTIPPTCWHLSTTPDFIIWIQCAENVYNQTITVYFKTHLLGASALPGHLNICVCICQRTK